MPIGKKRLKKIANIQIHQYLSACMSHVVLELHSTCKFLLDRLTFSLCFVFYFFISFYFCFSFQIRQQTKTKIGEGRLLPGKN